MRKSIIALALLLVCPLAVAAPRLWGDLKPGKHAVGFRTFASESAPGSAGWEARPIEVALWYPCEANGSAAMTFADYVRASPDFRRRSFPEAADDLDKVLSAAITGDATALPRDTTQAILAGELLAHRDTSPARGKYPIVIWSARYGTTAAQALLSEFLASNGYLVAFARPASAEEKLPFELKTADEKLEELDAQTDDLRGAVRAIRELPNADKERTAVIAWSYAGEAAVRLQQGDATMRAVVALSTNTLEEWVYQSPDALTHFSHTPLRVPHVFLTQKTQMPAIWSQLPPESRFVSYHKLAHGNFNFVEGMLPGLFAIDKVQRWSRGGADAKTGYESMALDILEPLNELMKATPRRAYDTIRFRAKDKVDVTADVYRAANPRGCIALLHQSGSSRGEFRTIAPELARIGFTSIAPDLRWGRRDRWNDVWNETAKRYGTIELQDTNDRENLSRIRGDLDADAALDWLAANCKGPQVVWGASIHANRAIESAARTAAVIAFSPGEYRKAEPEKMRTIAATIKVPALVFWGRGEAEVSKPVFDALASTVKLSYASPAGRHGSAILFEDPIAWDRLRAFLNDVAKP